MVHLGLAGEVSDPVLLGEVAKVRADSVGPGGVPDGPPAHISSWWWRLTTGPRTDDVVDGSAHVPRHPLQLVEVEVVGLATFEPRQARGPPSRACSSRYGHAEV